MLKQGGKVKSVIHEATAEGHSNMLKFGENEPEKVEEICTAAHAKVAPLGTRYILPGRKESWSMFPIPVIHYSEHMPSPLWCQKSSGSTSLSEANVQVTEREMS